jgi:anti-sigma factor RsiW
MDCREFRKKHVAYVDDLLSAVEMDAMQQHSATCSRCARQDTMVRRSLMLVRSLPPIEPSSDFMQRLNARIERMGPVARVDVVGSRPQLPLTAFAAFAAGIAAVAYLAVETTHYFAPASLGQPVPAIATLPETPTTPPMANAAFVASVPTGMPVWPAVLMVGQAPMEFASMQFREASLTR